MLRFTLAVTSALTILLTVIFVIMKMAGRIHWQWVWVLAPIWGALLAGVLLAVPALVVLRLMFREGRNIP